MKKLIFLSVFSLALLFGCNKEESALTIESLDAQKQGEFSTWILNLDGESPVWEVTTIREQQSHSDSVIPKANGNSVHTHGDYATASYSLSWSGTQNNGGAHGSAYFEQTFGPTTVQVTMETECIMVEGNEAVYGGTFTKVSSNNPLPPGLFDVGNHMYFKVIDNGQGKNASPDQRTSLAITSSSSTRCDIYTPGHPFWATISIVDIEEPGSVKIND